MKIQAIATHLLAIITITLIPGVATAQTMSGSAWHELLSRTPEAVDDLSIEWRDRLILSRLTPRQARQYFSGQLSADQIMLTDAQTLEEFLAARLSPAANVYIPLEAPCPLLAEGQIFEPGTLSITVRRPQDALCSVDRTATTLLVRLDVEAATGIVPRIKVWASDLPEPAVPVIVPGDGTTTRRQETLLVPLCRAERCREGDFELKVSEAALLSAAVLGYFRPLNEEDGVGGGRIMLATETADETFFGVGAGANNTGFDNSFFGVNAGFSNTTGSQNSFFGENAGFSNTEGLSNSFFGRNAGFFNTTGSDNSFFGEDVGVSNTTGSQNSFFGEEAGLFNTTGSQNSFFGERAGFNNTSGNSNSFFGQAAGLSNAIGNNNSFFGEDAGLSNTEGSQNSFFGERAGFNNTIGNNNSFFGQNAGRNNTTGNLNTFVGLSSGSSNTTESLNTFLGAFSDGADGVFRSTAIGSRALVSQSDSLVLGSINGLNGATASVKVGIGTDVPKAPLHVQRADDTVQIVRAQSIGPEAIRNMMDLINNGIPQFRLVDTSADGNNWQFSNTNSGLNISLQGSGSQELLIEDDGDVFINNGTVQVTSSRETKENFKAVDSEEILKRIAELDISEWNYVKDENSVRHIGPVSEEFYSLFGLGNGDKHITPSDLSGVALAALKGLLARLESEVDRNRQMSEELANLRRQIKKMKQLEARLDRLEALSVAAAEK